MTKDLLNNVVIAPIDYSITVGYVTISSDSLSLGMSNGDCIELTYNLVNVNSSESKSYKIRSIKFNKSDIPISNVSQSLYIDIYSLDSIVNILKKLYNKCNILKRY